MHIQDNHFINKLWNELYEPTIAHIKLYERNI